jgi:hypothetical protein
MTIRENHAYSFKASLFWRFIFLYLILYIYPYGFEYIYELKPDTISFWPEITTRFGETVLGWDYKSANLQSGSDSKYDYTRFLLIAIVSLIGSGVWVFIDSKIKRLYTAKLKTLTQTVLRYHVGLTLIIYGLSKVLMLQFGLMDITGLETKIGNQTGMSFLWEFMSYSEFYTTTAGLIEVIGGVLILFRRTTFIGAFILFVAMANVVLMDIGFNVSVKMFAIHLFLMIILIMSDHLKQMIRFFITHKPTIPISFQPLFNTVKSKKFRYILKGLILLFFTITTVNQFKDRLENEIDTTYTALASLHDIDLFVKNGDTLTRKSNDLSRWKTLMINGYSYYPKTISVTYENGKSDWFSFEADTLAKRIDFQNFQDTTALKYPFHYKTLNKKRFEFKGVLKGDTLHFKTKAKFIKDYKLTSMGIKWIPDL